LLPRCHLLTIYKGAFAATHIVDVHVIQDAAEQRMLSARALEPFGDSKITLCGIAAKCVPLVIEVKRQGSLSCLDNCQIAIRSPRRHHFSYFGPGRAAERLCHQFSNLSRRKTVWREAFGVSLIDRKF